LGERAGDALELSVEADANRLAWAFSHPTPSAQNAVQAHDILYRESQDIPYTLQRVERAEEREGCPGKPWTYKSNGYGS